MSETQASGSGGGNYTIRHPNGPTVALTPEEWQVFNDALNENGVMDYLISGTEQQKNIGERLSKDLFSTKVSA